METINSVLARYIPTATELIGGQLRRRKVSAGNEVGADYQIREDLYDVLYKRLGSSIIDNISPPEEQEFQTAATALSAKKASKKKYQEPAPGPVPPPLPIEHTSGSGYVRDPVVAGAAISKSGYLCEWDPTHLSFVSRITQENFVEAHHLIPMQFQGAFVASLDVIENITVLCPTCHRLLHHGRAKDKEGRLAALYINRVELLKGRGLVLSFSQLLSFLSRRVGS